MTLIWKHRRSESGRLACDDCSAPIALGQRFYSRAVRTRPHGPFVVRAYCEVCGRPRRNEEVARAAEED